MEIAEFSARHNMLALSKPTQNLFRMIAIVELNEIKVSRLMEFLELSEPSIYRLIAVCNDFLWDKKIVNSRGTLKIIKRDC